MAKILLGEVAMGTEGREVSGRKKTGIDSTDT